MFASLTITAGMDINAYVSLTASTGVESCAAAKPVSASLSV